jgi:hypothetical protein
MPSYFLSTNKLVIDTKDADYTAAAEELFQHPPAAKHSEAHDTYTRSVHVKLGAQSDPDNVEAPIYDEIVRRGGYTYADVEYDNELFFMTITLSTYFRDEATFNDYFDWVMTQDILSAYAVENDDPKAAYADPANSPGRGYTEIVQTTVDFNKPYRD